MTRCDACGQPLPTPAGTMSGRCPECTQSHDIERLATLRDRIRDTMLRRGWSLDWIDRSAYLHLEAAELAEAVRGKRGDPVDEAGDVLITLLALSPVGLLEIVAAAEAKLADLQTRPPYAGEERG